MSVALSRKWFTCTPKEFGGAEDFFARDSGLLSRALKANGVESMAVMPGLRKPEDLDELIRTDYANLESAEWWKSHGLDGVVLYAWGSPRYRKIAAAIRMAGIFLILNQDNGGLVSPLAGFSPWLREQWNHAGKGRGIASYLRFLKLTAKGLSYCLLHTDPGRAAHLRNGDRISCVSPFAAECYRKLCTIYGGEVLAKKVKVLPHPVESRFYYDGRSKKRQIVTVGRWQDTLQKRPWLLAEVVTALTTSDKDLHIVIAGQSTPELDCWHSELPEDCRRRIVLRGPTDRETLADLMADSQIFYSPSAFESFGIAAAEALCCGSSVVAGRSVSMPSFDWFVSENSGTLAVPDTASAHIAALRCELDKWDSGQRAPARISEIWCRRVHAENVAAQVLAMK